MNSRRQVLAGAAAAGGLAVLQRFWPPASARAIVPGSALTPIAAQVVDGVRCFDLKAMQLRWPLLDNRPETPIWSYAPSLLPMLNAKRGEPVRVRLRNTLGEHTSIHWHGIRVPNAMDGVPYVTQKPVYPGGHFIYEFTPPDAGTFFFHPHCNEADQTGRGLAGVLIVAGDEAEPFDDDIPLAVKDWRLDAEGRYLPIYTAAGASRAGTFGTVRTVNGMAHFQRVVPAHGHVRVRVINLDSTRILEVGVEGAKANIIAIDGNAIEPLVLDTWRMAPAMRLDLAIAAPAPGETLRLVDYAQAELFTLAELRAGDPVSSKRKDMPRLRASPIPEPDLSNAVAQTYVFGATSEALTEFIQSLDPGDPLYGTILDTLCAGPQTFWAINKTSWPNDGHRTLPPPLAELKAGKTYRFMLHNVTPHSHPIHLHGHTFKVLSSSKRTLPVHYADTVLVTPKERIDIAFVAREGDWMFHCHILEHLGTGMMGYFRIA